MKCIISSATLKNNTSVAHGCEVELLPPSKGNEETEELE